MDTAYEVMIGNHAIARGLVEAGLDLAAAYPGTPSSEILPGIIRFNSREHGNTHAEWSTNERCAFEVAFGAAVAGQRAACMMKQVGLNVAFPPLLRGRNKPLKGALVIVSCDDPGPQSSQTEQDTRLLASLFGIPLFDPASPAEAGDAAYYALKYSFEHKTPVILRSTHRVSHAREAVPLYPPGSRSMVLREGVQAGRGSRLGIISSGMSFSLAFDVLAHLGIEENVSLYKVMRVVPADKGMAEFVKTCQKVLIIEETDAVLEAIIGGGSKVLGRRNGYVPSEGELTYDVVRGLIERALTETGIWGEDRKRFVPDDSIGKALADVPFASRVPRLCAGCPHRASFYAMRQAFPGAVFPGDIGCYTLGISMGAVDTCLDMGSGVTFAAGFYDSYVQDGKPVPVIASIGDSTFFHACLTPLYDAVLKQKKFILVLMDNSTTAMTGMQPTPQTGIAADGTAVHSIPIEDILAGFGIGFVKIVDPYDVPLVIDTVREAQAYLEGNGNTPAVIITRRECVLLSKAAGEGRFDPSAFQADCTGCGTCVDLFDCPALEFDEKEGRVVIDDGLCARCGTCLYICPMQGAM